MTPILYHFTAGVFIDKIRHDGLTKGVLPWNLNRQGRPTFKSPFQWLTTNPDWAQTWCLLGSLPFARNAHRITVHVPEPQRQHLLKWTELCQRCQPDSASEINLAGGDHENWWLFHGRIPASWFLAVDVNFGERITPTAN